MNEILQFSKSCPRPQLLHPFSRELEYQSTRGEEIDDQKTDAWGSTTSLATKSGEAPNASSRDRNLPDLLPQNKLKIK